MSDGLPSLRAVCRGPLWPGGGVVTADRSELDSVAGLANLGLEVGHDRITASGNVVR